MFAPENLSDFSNKLSINLCCSSVFGPIPVILLIAAKSSNSVSVRPSSLSLITCFVTGSIKLFAPFNIPSIFA